MNGPETRPSLLIRLRDSSQQAAWQEFVEIYEPLVYRLALKRGLQHADAADVAQEVFAVVEKAIGDFDPDPSKGSFRGWLFRIARNLALNHLTRCREPRGSGDSSVQRLLDSTPDESSEVATEFQMEFRRQIFRMASDRVKQQVNSTTWRAFWLTGVEGESIEAAAKLLNKSVGAIRIARCRVLARIREEVRRIEPTIQE